MSISLEQTLAAVLQAEVDKRVAAVQAAANAWVEAFRQQAEAIARGESPAFGVNLAPRDAVPLTPPGWPLPSDAPETMPAHMQPPPGTEDDTPPTWVVTDSAAMAANMSVR